MLHPATIFTNNTSKQNLKDMRWKKFSCNIELRDV